ncbi:MAG TPA: ABC transporter substrate-binding protein [Solirubrobacteraceae bacterium]|jgi:peptide/nickel transport system substrate-binding protein|nr:ABC transporter substrate-binding protein [Solirubrobacteraceae bacterium]
MAMVLTALIAGCGGGGKEASNGAATNSSTGSSKPYAELRWGEPTFPARIDWDALSWPQAIQAESLVVQNLVEFEPNGRLKPELASSIEHPNATTYIYNVKTGVKFSDGKPLTVADVVYSLRYAMASKESDNKPYWSDVASVTAHGNSAVMVKLKRPSAIWPYILAFSGQIMEKAQAEKIGEKALGTPSGLLIGTGPWKFDSFTPEASIHLSPNPYWRGPSRPASRITFTLFKSESTMALALRSGAIDGASWYTTPKLFTGIPDVRNMDTPLEYTEVLSMGSESPPLNDVHVRRAIAYAIDAKGMIKALYPPGDASEVATFTPASLYPNYAPGEVNAMLARLPKYDFDLAAAKAELAKSSYPHGFSTAIQVEATSTAEVSAAQILASDLAKIGINAAVHEQQPAEESVLYGKKVKLHIYEIGAAYPDPVSMTSELLSPSQIGSGLLNLASYRNKEVERLLPLSEEVTNPKQRLALIEKTLKLANSDAVYPMMWAIGVFGAISEKYVYPGFSTWTAAYTPWALRVKLAG